jgi:hypothetical protein
VCRRPALGIAVEQERQASHAYGGRSISVGSRRRRTPAWADLGLRAGRGTRGPCWGSSRRAGQSRASI